MNRISMEQLFQQIQAGLQANETILDVREGDEFQMGHLPGSLNIPLSTLDRRIEELRNFSKIYIHCQAGGRAQRAWSFLQSQGITQLICVADGGFGNWKAAGYPVEK